MVLWISFYNGHAVRNAESEANNRTVLALPAVTPIKILATQQYPPMHFERSIAVRTFAAWISARWGNAFNRMGHKSDRDGSSWSNSTAII